jgi:hypothetical protein
MTGNLDVAIEKFFVNKPPSFTRAFLRSLDSPFGQKIRPEFIKPIITTMAPIFPGLGITGSAGYAVQPSNEALALSQLRIGFFSQTIGKELMTTIGLPSVESLHAFRIVFTLQDEHLKLAMPWVSGGLIKDELIRQFLFSAVKAGSNIVHASRVIRYLMMLVAPEILLCLICNPEFLKGDSFACVCVVFREFEEFLRRKGQKEMLEFCDVFHGDGNDMFEEEERKKVFRELGKLENVAYMLHEVGNRG